MRENTASVVYDYLRDKIASLGYELYDVEYVKKLNGMNLTVFIDKDSAPITIDDCQTVHERVDVWLDELNPTHDAPYYLNVSSVGLDRPIKTDKDYMRNIGKVVDVRLYTPVDGAKEYTSTLMSFSPDEVTLESKTLERKNVALCRLHIDF